jgi:hypothetical protein
VPKNHVIKAYREFEGKTPHILNLYTRSRREVTPEKKLTVAIGQETACTLNVMSKRKTSAGIKLRSSNP